MAGIASVIGTSVIGTASSALFLAHGLHVVVNDPRPDIERVVKDVMEKNRVHLAGAWLPR
jgi:ketoreductase RED1